MKKTWLSCLLVISILSSLGAGFLAQPLEVSADEIPSVVATIDVADGGYYATGVGVNSTTNRIYVVTGNSVNVKVIDGASNSVVANVDTGSHYFSEGVAVNATTNRIYVTAGYNSVMVIDGASNSVVAEVSTDIYPGALAVDAATNHIYAVHTIVDRVTVSDGTSNNGVAEVIVGSYPKGIAVNSITNRIYVVNSKSASVSVIDGATNSVLTTVGTGSNPWSVAVNPNTNRIYVTNGDSVSIIDGVGNNVVANVSIGSAPQGIAVNSATNRIYVTNGDSVSIIDGVSNNVVANVSVGSAPEGIAANPATNRIYVVNRMSGTVSVIQDGQYIPVGTTACLMSSPNPSSPGHSVTFTAMVRQSLPPSGNANLTGAGAAFPQPLYAKWSDEFLTLTDAGVSYQAFGSGTGIQQITAGTIDFAGSDAIMTPEQQAAAEAAHGPILHIPMTTNAIALICNLQNVPSGTLKLTGDVLARIYLKQVTSWNDPAIIGLNPGLNLPNSPIVVVHRSDGCGTTAIFTNYLCKVNSDWSSQVGYATSVDWPGDIGGQGNAGVAAQVQQTPGAIGYVDMSYALQNNLNLTKLQNSSGIYLLPSLEAATKASEGITLPDDMKIMITNSPNPDAYPIVGFTWILAYVNQTNRDRGQTLANWLWWTIHDGQQYASQLSFPTLSSSSIVKIENEILSIQYQGQPLLSVIQPTGSVVFRDGDTILQTIPLDAYGLAVCSTQSLEPGTHFISASYTGDLNLAPSSGTLTQVVNSPTVGMTVMPVNKLELIMPWIALVGVMMAGLGSWLLLRRRSFQV